MKPAVWTNYQKTVLIPFYDENNVRCCENCAGTFGLSFHHIIRRSHGGKNELSNIILLCAECHHKADNASGHVEFNQNLIYKAIKRWWNVEGYFDSILEGTFL